MKNTLKTLVPYALVGVVSGATTFGAFKAFEHADSSNQDYSYFAPKSNAQFVNLNTAGTGEDFVKAAKTTVPAVVTIKNYQSRTQSNHGLCRSIYSRRK